MLWMRQVLRARGHFPAPIGNSSWSHRALPGSAAALGEASALRPEADLKVTRGSPQRPGTQEHLPWASEDGQDDQMEISIHRQLHRADPPARPHLLAPPPWPPASALRKKEQSVKTGNRAAWVL